MDIAAVNSLNSSNLVSGFSLNDLNDNLIESDKDLIVRTAGVANSLTKLATSSGRQELVLDQINSGIAKIYSDAQSDDIEAMKLRQSVDGLNDTLEDSIETDSVEPEFASDDKPKKDGGIFDTIIGLGAFLLAPLTKAFGGLKGKLLTGILKIGKFIGNIFSAPMKLLKGAKIAKIFAPITKVFGFIGRIFKPMAKLLPILKVGGRFAKGIPVIGTVIAAVMAIFDGFTGWFKAADISGKSEKLLTIGDRVMSSIASIISGLTFGFLDVKKVFQFLSTSWEKIQLVFKDTVAFISGLLRGDDATIGKLKDYFSGLLDSITGFFTSTYDSIKSTMDDAFTLVKDSLITAFDGIKDFLLDTFDLITAPYKALFSFGKDLFSKISDLSIEDMLPVSVKNSWIGKKMLGMMESDSTDVPTVSPVASIQAVPNSMVNTDIIESKTRLVETSKANVQSSQSAAPIIVPQIQTVEKEVPISSKRVMSVNDMGIGFMNMDMT